MTDKIRTRLRCVIVDPDVQTYALCTGISIEVPRGLTRQQAIDYVSGVIAREVSRYAASEALGCGPFGNDPNYWSEIVT